MTTIAILRDGRPVRIHLFDNPIFDVEGFLMRFTTSGVSPEIYRYYQHSEFKTVDRKKPDLSGYYNETLFKSYIQGIEPIPILGHTFVKYDFEKVLATDGEEITVKTIDFNEPYDYFYNSKEYTFNLKRSPDQKRVANYLKPILENLRIVDYKIDLDGVNGITILNNQSITPGGAFYKKNFGDYVNSWTISNIQKSEFKKLMSLIVFKIREINKDIIPIIATNTHLFDKESDVADGTIDYNDPTLGLTDIEKLLFDIKRGWGYYYNPMVTISPLRLDFDTQFSSFSTYQDYLSYYSSLINFYDRCYDTKNLGYYSSDKKFQYLLEILSPSALGVLPYSYIINAIKGLLLRKLDEDDQRFLVRLVISVTPSHANEFLDFLLEKENGKQTNFQTIYEALTDGRLERYPFVNWFVDEQTNKKYFAFAIFEHWKVSKYNLNYIRPGIVVPDAFPNFKGIDPENYFYINKNEYNEKNWLTFIPSSTELITTTAQYFESSLVGKKIVINKISKTDINIEHGGYHDRNVAAFGSFHLYQQISFSGFKANLDLAIPITATLPAFLFHFIQEYDELADFDAAVSLAINLTVEVLLAYFAGGVNVLADLQYLKYTTKIGQALTGGLEATEAVVVWRGLEVGSEVFTLTAGALTEINTYLIATENDENKRKILEGYQNILLSLLFIGAGASLTARAHAAREAGRVLDLIDALPSGVAHGLNVDMMNLLTTLTGSKAVTLTTFRNRLNTLDLGGATNTIFSKYNTVFTDAQKLKFFNDFKHIDDPAFWKLLNSGKGVDNILNGKYIDNWISLSERGLTEAKFTDYICVQRRTDAIIRFVDEPTIKPVLGDLNYERKLAFLDRFGTSSSTNFIKFVENPDLVNYWIRFHYDNAFDGFKSLTNSKQITFLEHYGDCSVDVFNRIKRGNLVRYWEKVNDNPLDVSVHSIYIKNVDYLETVWKTHVSRNHGELLVNHLKGTIKKAVHNGNNLVIGYSGLHFDFVITEPSPLTFITTTINGKIYKIGPPPTVSASVQSAIKAGSEFPVPVPVSGAKDCEVFVWGYIRENIGTRNNPNMQFILDGSGNPIQGWVGKTNSSKTTLFVGISEEKALNEIAFARYNLNPNSWVRPTNGQSSAKWQGLSSEGQKIQMFLGNKVSVQPAVVPSSTLDYGSAFPTLLP